LKEVSREIDAKGGKQSFKGIDPEAEMCAIVAQYFTRDKNKKKLCKENRVNLLYYTEENVMDASTFTDKEKIIEEIKKLHYERNLFERG